MRLQPRERRPPKHSSRNAAAAIQKRHVSVAYIIKHNLAQAPVQEGQHVGKGQTLR